MSYRNQIIDLARFFSTVRSMKEKYRSSFMNNYKGLDAISIQLSLIAKEYIAKLKSPFPKQTNLNFGRKGYMDIIKIMDALDSVNVSDKLEYDFFAISMSVRRFDTSDKHVMITLSEITGLSIKDTLRNINVEYYVMGNPIDVEKIMGFVVNYDTLYSFFDKNGKEVLKKMYEVFFGNI